VAARWKILTLAPITTKTRADKDDAVTQSIDSHADQSVAFLEKTRRRRHGRSRRRNVFLIITLTMLGLLVLGGPSLISHSSVGRSMVTSTLAGYGLNGEIKALRIGWVTPLRIEQLHVRGASGATELSIDRIDADVTAFDLIRGVSPSQHVIVGGVRLACQVTDGRCSVEDDIAGLLEGPSSNEPTNGHIELTDVTATLKDSITGQVWELAQASADIDISSENRVAQTTASFTGVLSESGVSGGALQGSIELKSAQLDSSQGESVQWQVSLQSESLPLSVVSILRRRFPESASTIPPIVQGDATGEIVLAGGSDGSIDASIRGLNIRNLTAFEYQNTDAQTIGSSPSPNPTTKLLWQNSLATIDGDLLLTEHRLIGKRLVATTDFGKASIDGAFSRDFSWMGTADNPLRWLEGIDGVAEVEFDLPALQSSLPGILPIRTDARLASGRAIASVKSLAPQGPGDVRRSELTLHSDAIRARSGGRDVLIDPIDLSGIVASDQRGVRAERFQWSSSFGKAVGQGDLRSGGADIDVNFGRLFAILQPIIDLSRTQLSGIAKGNIRWDAAEDGQWRLSGRGNADNMLVTLPSGQRFERDSISGEVEAVGRWGNQSLQTLSQAIVTLSTGQPGKDSLDLKAELLAAIENPSLDVPMPVGVRSSGYLETLQEIAAPWYPTSLRRTSGQFEASARTEVTASSLKINRAHAELSDTLIAYADRTFRQQTTTISLVGNLTLPVFTLNAEELSINSDSLTAQAQGQMNSEVIDLKVQWSADLAGLQSVTANPMASRSDHRAAIAQVSFDSDLRGVDKNQWAMMGNCQGTCSISKDGDWIEVRQETDGTNIAIIGPSGSQPINSGVVWSEPNVKLGGSLRLNLTSGTYVAKGFEVAGDWFAAAIDGDVQLTHDNLLAKLSGPVRLKMDTVAEKLTPLAGTEIVLAGVHEAVVSLDVVQSFRAGGDLHLKATTEIGWDSGEVAGVQFGAARVPIEVSPTTVFVAPTKIPIQQGFVRAAGKVHYRPIAIAGPGSNSMSMELDPGVIAESIELTPELTERWLKYLAPVAANSAKIKGTLSAQVREAFIVFDDPNQTRVSGQLDIGGAEMAAGPIADQILAGVNQLTALASLVGGRSTSAKPGQTLMTMPAQKIDFTVDRGIVTHDRMYFNIDRASVVTSGQVGLDGRLKLTAQVPLDARWLGRDLQALAGQSITLPIDGTLSRPSVDSSGVSRVVKDLSAKAIQQTTENYLQKQLERGFEKILGR
jgi:hypothetical protein